MNTNKVTATDSIFGRVFNYLFFLIRLIRLNRIPFVRNSYYKFRNAFLSLPNQDDVLINFSGIKMYSWNPSSSRVAAILYRRGIFEPDVTNFLAKVVKEGMTLLDVGADRGYYTLLFAKWTGDEGMVLAFEPIPYSRERLYKNIELNDFKNVKVYDFALSDSVGEAVMPEPGKDSRIVLNNDEVARHRGSLRVKLVKYDDYFRNKLGRKIDLVKIDTEGAEFNILLGMRETILRDSPSFLIEIHNQKIKYFGHEVSEIFGFFEELQYSHKNVDKEYGYQHVYFHKKKSE